MSYFLSDRPLAAGRLLTLEGEEAEHLLKSRRTQPGGRFSLQDPHGTRFLAELVSGQRRRAEIRVLEPEPVPPPPAVRVTLLQAAVKDKAAEWIVQKATELGVAEVVFFPLHNSSVPLKTLRAARTVSRWRRIAWEACKQSGRQFPPALSVADHLDAVLESHAPGHGAQGRGWLLLPGGQAPPCAEGVPLPVAVLVGAEGGFTECETAPALAAGFIPVALGKHMLRAETAALAACVLALLA